MIEMTDEAKELVQQLVESLDGTCLHEWDLNKSAALGGLVLTTPNGRRFAVQLMAWPIAESRGTETKGDRVT